jgi:hypothetical protein
MHSEDGGNVMCVFARGNPEASDAAPVGLPDNVARLREMFRTHTTLGHYATTTPYRRALERLARRRRENRQLKALPTMEALLDWGRQMASAATGAPPRR